MIDYQAVLYDPIYSILGVPATVLTIANNAFSVTVLDRTAGAKEKVGPNIVIETVQPSCRARMQELIALEIEPPDLEMAEITFNGRGWRIRSYDPRPSPNGEDDGELELFLTLAVAVTTGTGGGSGSGGGGGAGLHVAAGAGEADGSSAASGGGAFVISRAAGEADGSSTVSGAGASIHVVAGAGEADGSSTAAGGGASVISSGAGKADGSSTAAGGGASLVAGAGEADGSAVASASGLSGGADMSLLKNVGGQNVTFALIGSSDQGVLGALPVVYVTIDGGAQASGAGAISEKGHGQYNYVPTQSETNGNCLSFLMTAPGAIPENIMCLTAGLHKNVANQNITFGLYSATDGSAIIGASPTVYLTKDDGVQAVGTGTITEKGHGQYNYAMTQADTNATNVSVLTTASGAVPQNLSIWTVTP